jgi:MSHA biogenesis protein MshQ
MHVALGQVPRHGILEFKESATFQVPTGVSHIVVELWGAGGGGASAVVGLGPNGGGGGGGSGAYIRASLAMIEGQKYFIAIGSGGRGGAGESKNVAAADGASGADSSIQIGQTMLLVANGGQGGKAAARGNVRGGRAGAGGVGTPIPWMIIRSGNQGSDGQMGGTPESNSTPGGEGGPAISGTLAPFGSFGGSGGTGGTFGVGGRPGADGGPGLAMIVW